MRFAPKTVFIACLIMELKRKSLLLDIRGNQSSGRLRVWSFVRLLLPGITSAKWFVSSPYMISANITLSGTLLRRNSCKSSKSSKIMILAAKYKEERMQEETWPAIVVEQGEPSWMVCSVYHNSNTARQERPLRKRTFGKVKKQRCWWPSDEGRKYKRRRRDQIGM